MPKRKRPEGTGEITVDFIPNTIIQKLNAIARNNYGVSRNAFLKTEFFKIVEREEMKPKPKQL